jgi:ABC-type polysaccharide transport system permease subunit
MIVVVLPIIQDVTFVQLILGITSCHCGKYENLHELQRKVVGNATEKVTIFIYLFIYLFILPQ